LEFLENSELLLEMGKVYLILDRRTHRNDEEADSLKARHDELINGVFDVCWVSIRDDYAYLVVHVVFY